MSSKPLRPWRDDAGPNRSSNASLSQTQVIRLTQLRNGGDPCYLSDKRYTCGEKCEWSQECRQLRAKWTI